MSGQPLVEVEVTVVGNPSMVAESGTITLRNERFPSIAELFDNVGILCDERPFRVYWRLSENEYIPVRGFVSLKASLNLALSPRLYAVADEPGFEDSRPAKNFHSNRVDWARSSLEDPAGWQRISADIELLQRAILDKERASPWSWPGQFDYLYARTPPPFTAERRDLDAQLNVLMNALSLLCVKKFSGSATMMEAPPGSQECLLAAARRSVSSAEVERMLFGSTNSIYVLDHTPESLPDMDMLQLFASPAGRALLTDDNRPRRSTSTSSLSRELSTRLKSGRRPSGTGTASAPTSPPARGNRQRKSSAELYEEAVEILGLTCSLTDSCRCMDCQGHYFDCDYGDARTELAAGMPGVLDHTMYHPMTCSIQ